MTNHECHQISIIPCDDKIHFKIRWYTGLWMVSSGGYDILYTDKDEEENKKSNQKFNYQWFIEHIDNDNTDFFPRYDMPFYLRQNSSYVARKEVASEGNNVKLEKKRDLGLIFWEKTIS